MSAIFYWLVLDREAFHILYGLLMWWKLGIVSIFDCKTPKVMYLSFSTLCPSSLWSVFLFFEKAT